MSPWQPPLLQARQGPATIRPAGPRYDTPGRTPLRYARQGPATIRAEPVARGVVAVSVMCRLIDTAGLDRPIAR